MVARSATSAWLSRNVGGTAKRTNSKSAQPGIESLFGDRKRKIAIPTLRKAGGVLVTGNVSARGYINNNGEAAASLDLNARDVRFLSSRGEDDQGGGWQGGNRQSGGRREDQRRDDRASNYADPPSSVDDIPF